MPRSLSFHKEGDWDTCAIALNGLLKAPEAVQNGLLDIANDIIVPRLNEVKASGDFAANAESTIRLKHHDVPWVGKGNHVTGEATAFKAGAGGVFVMMSGDQTIVDYVDKGTRGGIQPARPLFEKTWDSCKQEVIDAVDALIASAIAGGATGISASQHVNALGRFAGKSYGGAIRQSGFMDS